MSKISWKRVGDGIEKQLGLSILKHGVTGIDIGIVDFWDAKSLQYPSQIQITISHLGIVYKAYISKTSDNSRTRLCFRPELKTYLSKTYNTNAYMCITKIEDNKYSMSIETMDEFKDTHSTSTNNNTVISVNKEYFEGLQKEFNLLNRKRNRTAREKCIQNSKGKCCVCGFDFSKTYGSLGKGFLEVHHKVPISQYKNVHSITLNDLCAVCSNCHRMLHRTKDPMNVDELKKFVQKNN